MERRHVENWYLYLITKHTCRPLHTYLEGEREEYAASHELLCKKFLPVNTPEQYIFLRDALKAAGFLHLGSFLRLLVRDQPTESLIEVFNDLSNPPIRHVSQIVEPRKVLPKRVLEAIDWLR